MLFSLPIIFRMNHTFYKALTFLRGSMKLDIHGKIKYLENRNIYIWLCIIASYPTSAYHKFSWKGTFWRIISTICAQSNIFSLYSSIYQKKYQIKVCKIRLVLVEFRHKERGRYPANIWTKQGKHSQHFLSPVHV